MMAPTRTLLFAFPKTGAQMCRKTGLGSGWSRPVNEELGSNWFSLWKRRLIFASCPTFVLRFFPPQILSVFSAFFGAEGWKSQGSGEPPVRSI